LKSSRHRLRQVRSQWRVSRTLTSSPPCAGPNTVPITKESGDTELEQFFCGERVLLIAIGEVEAGVNLAKVGEENVPVNGNSVTIQLPESGILSTRLNEEKTRVYDRDFSLLNLGPDDDLVEEGREQALIEVDEATRKSGILGYEGEQR
jgi:hypothetical protein